MDEIAAAAGVTRQTVYAHFRSRQALLEAVTQLITEQVVAALNDLDLETNPATVALQSWLETAWGLLERYPVLPVPTPEQDRQAHAPVTARLSALIRRGQRTGEFDRRQSDEWLSAATIALGHAAAQEVNAGRMTSREAGHAFTTSVMRVYGVADPTAGPS